MLSFKDIGKKSFLGIRNFEDSCLVFFCAIYIFVIAGKNDETTSEKRLSKITKI